MTSPREAAVVAAGNREFKARGAWWTNTHGSVIGRAGIPDVIGVYRGRGIAIEYKRPDYDDPSTVPPASSNRGVVMAHTTVQIDRDHLGPRHRSPGCR